MHKELSHLYQEFKSQDFNVDFDSFHLIQTDFEAFATPRHKLLSIKMKKNEMHKAKGQVFVYDDD